MNFVINSIDDTLEKNYLTGLQLLSLEITGIITDEQIKIYKNWISFYKKWLSYTDNGGGFMMRNTAHFRNIHVLLLVYPTK